MTAIRKHLAGKTWIVANAIIINVDANIKIDSLVLSVIALSFI